MTHAIDAAARNDAAPSPDVHDPHKSSLRAMAPDELVGDEVQPIVSLADARRVVWLAQRRMLATEHGPTSTGAADAATIRRVVDALDDAWLAR